MVLIGIDPHKRSHTAVAIDETERVVGEVRVTAGRDQAARLLAWADRFPQRRWAIESAKGLGLLVSDQLVAAGEDVVDVPPKLAARVRVLDTGRKDKNDPNDARSVAIAALRSPTVRPVQRDEHAEVLRLLATRQKNLVSLRTQAVDRLHAMVANLVPGGLAKKATAAKALRLLDTVVATTAVARERVRLALELVEDIARLDGQLADVKKRIADAVAEADTTVTDVYGVGPFGAATVLGRVEDVSRFANADQFASFNGTAPVERSSGPNARHSLNRRGDRQINHALYIAAVTQVGHDTDGRRYYERKLAEGKTKKEALRALKRRISDAVYRRLRADAARHTLDRDNTGERLAS